MFCLFISNQDVIHEFLFSKRHMFLLTETQLELARSDMSGSMKFFNVSLTTVFTKLHVWSSGLRTNFRVHYFYQSEFTVWIIFLVKLCIFESVSFKIGIEALYFMEPGINKGSWKWSNICSTKEWLYKHDIPVLKPKLNETFCKPPPITSLLVEV